MAMDDLLLQTSQLLTRVTAHAAVVVGPQAEAVVIRGAHLALLQPRVVLAVVILSNGAVEKQVVFLDEDASDADVAIASARMGQLLDGHRIGDLPAWADDAVPDDAIAERLARAVCNALGQPPRYAPPRAALRRRCEPARGRAGRLHRHHGGAAHRAARAPRRTRVADARVLGPGLTVRIGSENANADLQEVSVVLAPYLVEGELVGTVGVLGPTRMDYRKAQAAVATVSQRLGRQLSP